MKQKTCFHARAQFFENSPCFGTERERITASEDLLTVGAHPAGSAYDECHPTKVDHDRAAILAAKTKAPRADPVYGEKGPLKHLWG